MQKKAAGTSRHKRFDSTEVTETAEAAEVRSIIVKDPMPTYMPGTDIHAQTYVHRHRKGRD